ncbi:MAG: hypothetical protein L0Z50_04410 [Verrucomicrobiales bacterium]|nr:hypothetical protein [Verrucomicrobiales bacterium]
MEARYSSFIDVTTFGIVRSYLGSARSPITTVLFVARRELLAQVAVALDPADEHQAELGQRQIRRWLQSGELRLGGFDDEESDTVDMSAVDDEARCAVIFLPPHYLVWLKEGRRLELLTHRSTDLERHGADFDHGLSHQR